MMLKSGEADWRLHCDKDMESGSGFDGVVVVGGGYAIWDSLDIVIFTTRLEGELDEEKGCNGIWDSVDHKWAIVEHMALLPIGPA
jgi:hypothetical protein